MPAAFRLPGLTEALREAFPRAGAPLYEAVTAPGDPAFLAVGLAVLYWVAAGRRPATARVAAYAFVAFAAIVGLKAGLALPRPPAAVHLTAADGFGFPSGHALGSTVVYGGLAVEYGRGGDRRALAATAGLIGAVSLSRVALGVHYLGDVLAGVAVGVVVLVAARAVAAGHLRRGFGLGLLVALPAVYATGWGESALGVAGACLGGLVAAGALDRVPTTASPREVVVLVVVGVASIAAVRRAALLLAGVPLGPALDEAVLVAGGLVLPAVVARADRGYWPAA